MSTPWVDRDDELELLKLTFARAVREPSVQLVTLMGEPGVGKSRLAAEFFAYVDDLPETTSWRQGRCLPYGEGVTFWGLGEIVKAQAGILGSDGAREPTRSWLPPSPLSWRISPSRVGFMRASHP